MPVLVIYPDIDLKAGDFIKMTERNAAVYKCDEADANAVALKDSKAGESNHAEFSDLHWHEWCMRLPSL